MYESPRVINGMVVGVERAFTPAELGFDGVSVKALATVIGNKIDLQGFKDFMLTLVIDNAGGGSTGLMKITIDLFDEQDVAILTAFDLVTAINLKADNVYTVCFGRTNTAKQNYTSGTPVLSGSADILRIPARMRISLTTTEVSNGTTVTATGYLRAAA